MKKKILYFDMDGVLVDFVYSNDLSIEEGTLLLVSCFPPT